MGACLDPAVSDCLSAKVTRATDPACHWSATVLNSDVTVQSSSTTAGKSWWSWLVDTGVLAVAKVRHRELTLGGTQFALSPFRADAACGVLLVVTVFAERAVAPDSGANGVPCSTRGISRGKSEH